MNTKTLDRLMARVSAMRGPTMKVFFADGSTRIVSSGDAIDLFLNGEGVKAESMSGHNGLLPSLLSALSENQQ